MNRVIKTKDFYGKLVRLTLTKFEGEIDNYHVYTAHDERGNGYTYKEALLNGDNNLAYPDKAGEGV